MSEGKLTVGVQVDASDAMSGFADAVLKEVLPALDQVRREMDSKLSGGGGGGGGWSAIGDIAGGSFIGAFAANIATKGLSLIESAVSKIGDVIKGILSSGWDRLTSIDTAKTKMEALGNSAADVKVIMANALAAVKGTSFGLQDAATVAATALAAGVKPGESLVKYLKLVADTAAVTRKAGHDMGAEFNDVGAIVNKITTQGYATNQELQMLSDRGLPIYQKLSQAMRIGTGDVIETAEKTGIAASKVREALENTVGGAALKMGTSLEGASANAQAALARLGEAFLKPIFEPAKDGLFTVTAAIDEVTKAIVNNGPEITQAFGAIAIAIVDGAFATVNALGVMVEAVGDVAAAFGDVNGALLTYQAWIDEHIRGDKEAAEANRKLAQESYGLGEATQKLGLQMQSVKPDSVTAGIRKLTDAIASGQQVNRDYARSQDEIVAAIKRGEGPMRYQAQMMEWINKVRAAATGGPPAGPAPNYQAAYGAAIAGQWYAPPASSAPAAGGAGGMPDDVGKKGAGGGSGTKPEAGPWVGAGGAIPTPEEVLAAGSAAGTAAAGAAASALPDASKDLAKTASVDLPQAAKDLSAAASSIAQNAGARGLGAGSFAPTARLDDSQGAGVASQPSVQAAAAAVMGLFGDQIRGNIGGSRSYQSAPNTHEVGLAMDIPIGPDQKPLGDAIRAYLMQNAQAMNIKYTIWRDSLIKTMGGNPQYVGGHQDHIDVQFNNGAPGAGAAAMPAFDMGAAIPNMPPIPGYDGGGGGGSGSPLSPGQSYGTPQYVPGLGMVVPVNETDYSQFGLQPGTYQMPGGVTPPDPAKIKAQQDVITGLNNDLRIKEQRIREMKEDAAQSAKMAASQEYKDLQDKIKAEEAKLEELKRGTTEKPQSFTVGEPKKAQPFDYNSLPFGHPARMMAGVLGGLGGTPEDISAIVGPMLGSPISSLGGPIGGAAGQVAGSAFGIPLGRIGAPTAPSTDLNQLVKEQNPLFLAQAAGINVPDYSRAGGGPQDVMGQGGPASDAMGRIYTDTAALIDRTFTNMDAAAKARHDQQMTVLNEVRDRLAKDYVGPVTKDAVTGGIDAMGSATSEAIGTSVGEAAAGPIAAAVASASPTVTSNNGGLGGSLVNTGMTALNAAGQGALSVGGFASGGAVVGPGTATSDSILARLSHGEWVLNARQVGYLGGFRGVQSIINGLPRFATGGGVDVSATVGAEAIGVSQIPIIGAIVNLLVAVLLKIIGVTIEARDTLNEISSDFRDFRGDFQAYDAYGRMKNDTSGLLDRSGSSTQAAVDERIRILKLVLEGLIKWLIEQIIVPIGKAVAETAINLGSQAVSGAISGGMGAAFPGGGAVGGAIGSIASSAISSAGGAATDIIAQVATTLMESLLGVMTESSFSLMQSLLPDLMTAMFGGGLMEQILNPVSKGIGGLFSGVTGLFGAVAGSLATVVPGAGFDSGGLAVGTGLMPKGTIHPERVLSPQQTASFDQLVQVLSAGRSANSTTIHAPFTVVGGERGGREARDRLLALMS